jgi:uncharacterized membrane protein YfcA
MLDFLIFFAIAAISGMGLGGGGLLVIYLTLVVGTPQIIAQGANLAFFIIAASFSTLYNAIKKQIKWKITLTMSASGIILAYLGTLTAGNMDSSILTKIFGAMLILGGLASLLSTFSKKKQNQNI